MKVSARAAEMSSNFVKKLGEGRVRLTSGIVSAE